MSKKCRSIIYVLVLLLLSNVTRATTIISLVGDSITSGYPEIWCGRGIQAFGGYAPYLEPLLDNNNWPSTVYNYGIAGDRAEWAYREFGKWCTDKTWFYNGAAIRHNQVEIALNGPDPSYMLYLFGTNDLSHHSAPTVLAYIQTGINKIKAGGAIPIVGTILPDTRAKGDIKDITGANALLRAWLNQNNIQVAEFYNATSQSGWANMMSDGLHPNPTGRQFMAQIWYQALLKRRARIAGTMAGINLMLLLND